MWQDLRFGYRTLAKSPGFTAVAITALALGIGANATVFSLANAILFKYLPFRDSDKLLFLATTNPRDPEDRDGLSVPDYLDLRSQLRSFQTLGANNRTRVNLSDDATVAESYIGARVTANTLAAIGQQPLLGRAFEPADEKPGAPPVIILSYNLWERRYAKDPAIVGKTVRVNAVPTTVAGVLPKGVLFPLETNFWLPLTVTGAEKRQDHEVDVYGLLAPGHTREEARAEIAVIERRLAAQYPETNRDSRFVLEDFHGISLRGKIRTIFLVLLAAVGFVLMIACANVANLMLSRAVGRSREIAIRTALGSGRWRVIRQLLAEGLLLSVAGGAIGLLIAQWGTRAFDAAVAPTGKPAWIDFSMDLRAFAYLAAVSLAATVLSALAPALRLSRLDINSALKDGGRGSSALRGRYLSGALVVIEMTLAVVLLAGAGLMLRSFLWAYSRPLGLDPSHILTMRFDLPASKYPKPSDQLAMHRQLIERLQTLPGVEIAAVTSSLPTNGTASNGYQTEETASNSTPPSAKVTLAGPGYFEALGVRTVEGRLLQSLDQNAGPEVAVVNQTLAAQAWPGRSAVGQRIRLMKAAGSGPWLTVVGVVPDLMPTSQRPKPDPALYQPYRQDPSPPRFTAVVAHTRVPPTTLGQAFREQVRALDRDLPVQDVSTLEDLLALDRWPLRVFGTMFAIFAVIALAMATVGLYAVVAYGVSRRTQEIGVRVALGASSGSILRMVFATGIRQAALGLALGLAAAYGVTRALKAILVGISPTDPLTFGLVAAVLLAAAILGCVVPARRATQVDPAIALRSE